MSTNYRVFVTRALHYTRLLTCLSLEVIGCPADFGTASVFPRSIRRHEMWACNMQHSTYNVVTW